MTWPGFDDKQNCAPCTLQRGQVEYEEGDEKGEEGKSQADHWNLNTLGEAGQWNPQVGQADHWNLNNACRSSSSLIPWETSSSIPPPPVKYFWIIVKRFSAHQSKQIEWSLCEPSPPLTNFSVRVQDYVFHLYVIYCYISPGKKYLPNPKRISLAEISKLLQRQSPVKCFANVNVGDLGFKFQNFLLITQRYLIDGHKKKSIFLVQAICVVGPRPSKYL